MKNARRSARPSWLLLAILLASPALAQTEKGRSEFRQVAESALDAVDRMTESATGPDCVFYAAKLEARKATQLVSRRARAGTEKRLAEALSSYLKNSAQSRESELLGRRFGPSKELEERVGREIEAAAASRKLAERLLAVL